ncbi:hypothetical protein GOP47_0007212 [Adiantum capillus-veneris]|uniref:Uncharacterized protein n=1 Tax=Adiantum capillus-veneris TaxID=13818 RepID=A0A9D4V154_ADICA|nr:hypothetical protein GOP47_0007212 [Adiantum capillus-veneris]
MLTQVVSSPSLLLGTMKGLFLEKFVEHSFEHMIDDRRHVLTYKDLATHVNHAKRFQFLADFVPEKVTAINALSNRIKQED